ncbi:TPA: LPXTG cell wall anchor domain-containing protein [Streptococcus suis]
MHVKKLVKWGVALTSTLVLGGVVGTEAGQLLNASSIVYAQNQESVTAVLTFYDVSDLSEIADRVYIDIKTGESIVYNYPVFDGYTLHEDYDSVLILDYDSVARRNGETIATGFRKVEKPAETPTEQPVEQPVETPADQPTEVPVETPVDQPVEQPTETPAEKPVETPTEQPVEQPVETPTEQPAEQPTEKPVTTSTGQPTEQPAITPTDQPTEKPTATSLLAGKEASKAQPVVTTDKKKVDNSTPSTNAVKPEEGSQATAKTLPKTGDSSSMLLMLGGLLSGLSGLGLAASSRKRD